MELENSSTDHSFEANKDKILYNVGRNVLNFQLLEQLLKALVAIAVVAGEPEKLKKLLEQKHEKASKQTMGNLVSQYVDTAHMDSDNSDDELIDDDKFYFSMRFSIPLDETEYLNKKARLKTLVDDRNDLVHHFRQRFNVSTNSGVKGALEFLTTQHNQLVKEIDELRCILKAFDDSRKKIFQFYQSEEGMQYISGTHVSQSTIVKELWKAANEHKDANDWMLLSKAAQLITDKYPDLISMSKSEFNKNSLRKLMVASNCFEFGERVNDKGGVEIAYRITDSLHIE